MVLKIAAVLYSHFPTQYLPHTLVCIVAILVVRAFSQGRVTNRERDLHARVILVTGGFTPVGLTLLQSLAQRGAHIIALTPLPITAPEISILITLLRSTTSNEQIFAEQCDLSSPTSIKAFCTRFLTGNEQRLDALIFAHEYQHVGPVGRLGQIKEADAMNEREEKSLATFLMITLLLPALLVAPVERDIRIINVINPFYAAAAGPVFEIPFQSQKASQKSKSLFLHEGTRALRTVIFTRHLQRILDALPSAQVPKTDDNTTTIPVVSAKSQKSNIVAVSVSPGISRTDTIMPMLNADWTIANGTSSRVGIFIYLTLQPILRVFTKSSLRSIQSILHVLFLPTPFKVKAKAPETNQADDATPEEVLKPGAMYSECAVLRLTVPPPQVPAEKVQEGKEEATKGLEIPDDGEMGGELCGRLVWEAYEAALLDWEAANPAPPTEAAPDVDAPQADVPAPS